MVMAAGAVRDDRGVDLVVRRDAHRDSRRNPHEVSVAVHTLGVDVVVPLVRVSRYEIIDRARQPTFVEPWLTKDILIATTTAPGDVVVNSRIHRFALGASCEDSPLSRQLFERFI